MYRTLSGIIIIWRRRRWCRRWGRRRRRPGILFGRRGPQGDNGVGRPELAGRRGVEHEDDEEAEEEADHGPVVLGQRPRHALHRRRRRGRRRRRRVGGHAVEALAQRPPVVSLPPALPPFVCVQEARRKPHFYKSPTCEHTTTFSFPLIPHYTYISTSWHPRLVSILVLPTLA